MAAFPIGKNDDPRTRAPNRRRDLQSVPPAVFDATVRNIERLAPAHLHEQAGLVGFALTIRSGAPGSEFASRKIEYARALPFLRHLEQSAAAGLFDIVAVS